MNRQSNVLLKNTFFLYLITFSNYLFGLITLPYETRVLGPEFFGKLGFAASFYTYFFVFLDFGFILSATKRVSENRNNSNEINKIITGVTISKCLLFLIIFIFFVIITLNVDYLRDNFIILFLYLIYAGIVSLIPDFFYRGIEKMKMVTYRTVLVRFVFTILIFVFLKKPEHYFLIPIFHIIGNAIALLWIFFDLKLSYQVKFIFPGWGYIRGLIKDSIQYFLSRVASTVYSATNTIVLGFIYPIGNVVGYYSSADKIRGLASQAAAPISDSFYPYMLRTRNYKKLIRITLLLETLIFVAGFLLWLYSEEFCVFVFGKEYIDVSPILRAMIPLLFLILPVYMFGFPALSPLGMAKWANYSVVFAMFSQVIGLIILYSFGNITPISIIILTTISESICLIVRLFTFIKGFRDLNSEI